jgi:hypothetical protein
MAYIDEKVMEKLEADDSYMGRQTDELIDQRIAVAAMIFRMGLILDRSTAIDHPDWDINLKPSSVKYDHATLEKIWELVSAEAIRESGAYTPEHPGPMVPPSWNVTKAKKLSKFSGAVADVIASAKIEGRAKLTFKKK